MRVRARQVFELACADAACVCCVHVRRSRVCVCGASPAKLPRLGAFFEEEALAEVGAAVEDEALPAGVPRGALAERGAALEDEARA